MKKVFTICLLLSAIISSVCFADDSHESKTPEWKINIEIQYNAVSREQAISILNKILKQHETACIVKNVIEKVDSFNFMTIDSTPGITWTPGDYEYDVIDTVVHGNEVHIPVGD